MIELKDVTKRYGSICAVDHASFHVKKGAIVGFLGQNGAGKSTTMNMITGYISRTSGDIIIDGKDILKHPREVKQKIGYLPEQPPLYPEMTVLEYLKFVCELKNVPAKQISTQVEHAIDVTKLKSVQRRIVANLSKGYKQRVGLAQTLCGDPQIIILDEPTVGLDPNQIVEIRDTIKHLGENHTVILSSHILHDVASVCESVIVIDHGKIIADDKISHLAKESTGTELIIRTEGEQEKVLSVLGEIEGVTVSLAGTISETINDYLLSSNTQRPRNDILQAMLKHNLPLLMLKPAASSLEDIFLRLTTQRKEA